LLPQCRRWRQWASQPPKWIRPQLTRLVDEAPSGQDWLHEIKYDGYRMHCRLADGKAQLLTRTGLDWSTQYAFTIEALSSLPAKTAYIDGELCAAVQMACRPSTHS
jgi:bifunctional non-homologous end joining protein LigD